jgi:adenine phosphoribosyltransferase
METGRPLPPSLPRVAESSSDVCGAPCYFAALDYADRLLLVASQRETLGTLLSADSAVLPGGARAYDVRALLGRPRAGAGGAGGAIEGEGAADLQSLVARRLAERLARAESLGGREDSSGDGAPRFFGRPLLLGIALGAGAEGRIDAARQVVEALTGLCVRIGVPIARDDARGDLRDEELDEGSGNTDHSAPGGPANSAALIPIAESLRSDVRGALPTFADWPRRGILFVDVLPLWRSPALIAPVLAAITDAVRAAPWARGLDFVAGLEARGFLFHSVALALNVPFVCVRKAGKLPGATFKKSYALEYGEAVLEVASDALPRPGARGLLVDDLLATGGTAAAAAALIREIGGAPVGLAVLVDIGIGGAARVGLPVLAVLKGY